MFKSEKGASAVEFAIIAPLLFVLTFGIIEFSLLLFDKAVVTNASREGARAAIVYNTNADLDAYEPIGETTIKNVVIDYAADHLISLGSSTTLEDDDIVIKCWDKDDPDHAIEPHDPPCETEGDVFVTVTYQYSFLVLSNLIKLLPGNFSDTFDLVGTTIMRME